MNENLLHILKPAYRHRKYILFTILAVTIGSIVLSLFLDNYYKASTIFYSASPDLAKPAPVGPVDLNVRFYGEDKDLDRLLSLSNSNEVFLYLVESFNLYKHYDIDSTQEKAAHKLRVKYDKLYSTQKTKYGALELSVEDKDPVVAADMANEARDKVAEIAQRVLKQSQSNLLKSYLDNISVKDLSLQSFSDSLLALREKFGVFSTLSQGEVLSGLYAKKMAGLEGLKARNRFYKKNGIYTDSLAYMEARIAGLKEQTKSIKNQIDNFNKGLDKVRSKELELSESSQQFGLDKEREKLLRATYNSPFATLHLVEKAEVPVYKSRPKRSIIVLGALILSAVLSILGTILLDSYNNIDWSALKDE